MRPYPKLLLLALTGWSCRVAPANAPTAAALFPIVVQGRWGFIDSTGAVVIAPRFTQVQGFAEGLAPAREAGQYGYINQQGQFILPQAYTYAAPFRQGLALVGPDSVPRLIDRAGHLVRLAAPYRQLQWQPSAGQSGVWIGTLPTNARQVLNAKGQLLTPAQFNRIGELSTNRLVVQRAVKLLVGHDTVERTQTGVLDGHGRLVIPYQRFDAISTFREGLAIASLYQTDSDETPAQECLIDTTGRIIAQLSQGQYFTSFEEGEFADGTARISITKSGTYPNDESYPAAIDRRGQVLFRQPGLRQLSPFGHGRAWAQGKDGWYLLDKAGRRLSTVAVQRVVRPGVSDAGPVFAGGAEVVELANGAGYAALASTGRVVCRLAEPEFRLNEPRQVGELMTFYGADSTQRMGFWNWRTGLLVPPRFSAISYAGYVHGLLAVVENNRLGYLNIQGRYVWQEAPAASQPLDLDYMRRSFYQVASATQVTHYASLGGWYRSGNLAKQLAPGSSAGQLTVHVEATPRPRAFAPTTAGHRLSITNTSADTAVFDAQDSNLYLTVQAQDTRGRWRNIEYIPSSFCGNSYHQVFLAPGQYWQLVVPAYRGGLRTQLRVQLLQHQGKHAQLSRILYSNVFPGSVNPAQFWRQEGYHSQGIMDPYTN